MYYLDIFKETMVEQVSPGDTFVLAEIEIKNIGSDRAYVGSSDFSIEEEERYRTEYKRSIKAKLNEIIDTWNKELAKDHIDQTKIQNEFDIYSNQLTSIISRAPDDFPEDVIEEFRELSTSLWGVKGFLIAMGPENYESFKRECQEITEKSKDIREKIE